MRHTRVMAFGRRWRRILAGAAALGVAAVAHAEPLAPAGTDLMAGVQPRFADAGKGEPVWRDSRAFTKDGNAAFRARWEFVVPAPSEYVALSLAKPHRAREWTLNGAPVPEPIANMGYRLVPGIPAALLKPGTNVLACSATIDVRKRQGGAFAPEREEVPIRLLGQKAEHLAFQTPPVMGAAGTNFFTVACRLTLPAEVVLAADGRTWTSPAGLVHLLRADGLKPAARYPYTLTARMPGREAGPAAGPHEARTLPADAPFTFAVLGDNRSRPDKWGAVVRGALAADPAFVVNTGDLVASGRDYMMWDAELFGPAREILATRPFYYVKGNHDEDSPLLDRMLPPPGGKHNWTERVGPVRLIGVDGAASWKADGPNVAWLRATLAASPEPYVFVFNHYAGWSSGPHGELRDGVPVEPPMLAMRRTILPILEEHRVTAVFAGHDHLYERSEPPGGVTIVIAGGAGAPLYAKTAEAARQNPHSKVFVSEIHSCFLDVTAERCSMRAVTPDGRELDRCEWKPRVSAR